MKTALSGFQQAIYDRTVEGLSNHEIAQQLGRNVRAIKDALTVIYKKRGVNTRAQLIVRHFKGNNIGSGDSQSLTTN